MIFSSLTAQNSDERDDDCIFSRDNTFIDNISFNIDSEGWIEFLPNGIFEPGDLFTTYKSNLGLSSDDELVLTRVSSGINNDNHYRYEQFYKGIPVECGRLIEHFRDCLLVSLNGKFLCDISMDINPSKSPSEVISIAMNDMNGIDYLWNDPVAELELQQDTEDPNATYYPNPELMIDCDKNLIYRFKLITLSESKEYRINANTGDIITKIDPSITCFHSEMNDIEHDCSSHHLKKAEKCSDENIIVGPIQTTGSTLFSGQQLMQTNWHYNIFTGGKHQLKYDFNKNKIETRDHELSLDENDWRKKVEHGGTSGAPFTWPTSDIRHTQTHWAIMNSWEYFRAVHGTSINRDNGTMRVKSNSGITNAKYLGDNRSLIFGSIAQLGGYLGTMDVAGHEFTHLAVHERSDLGQNSFFNNTEQRSLNESFADIFGTLIELEYRPGGGDWLMNSENVTLRNVRDPRLSPTIPGIQSGPQPEIYLVDPNWNANPGAAPHNNGGVQNKWFALLAEGGAHNGEWVEGIGIDKAAQITWHNLDNYIEVNSDYTDARNGAVQSAIDIFGACSFEHQQTMIAWEACGIGEWTSCYTQEGPSVICSDESNVPFSITMNGDSNSPLTWSPVDLSIGGIFTWGTSNWSWSTTGATNNTLVINDIPDNTNTSLLYLFRYEDELGNSGLVLISFADCLVSSDPDPNNQFNFCDFIYTRSNSNIIEETVNKIKVVPNPVKDHLIIHGIDTEEKYRIIDFTGREFTHGNILLNEKISVANLPNGIYIIQIIGNTKEIKYGKFIKAN